MSRSRFDLVDAYDTAPQSEWFRHCRKTAKPYVVIRRRGHCADVMWDYVTLPPRCDAILLQHEAQIREKAISIFEEYAENRSGLRVTPRLISFTDLPMDYVELAADDLYRLIESYVKASPQSPPH